MLVSILSACRGPVKNGNQNPAALSALSLHAGNENYAAIDTKQSVVTWKGSSLMGSNSHTGFVYLSQGELKIEHGQLTAGILEVDMNSIEDEKHGRDNGLVNHLKDPDFFDVKKFPFATLAISKVDPINEVNRKITGNLTIKGITHPVTFPAEIEVKNGVVKASGKLVIDRTKWDVRYKSKVFYDVVANQAISDEIEYQVKIIARR